MHKFTISAVGVAIAIASLAASAGGTATPRVDQREADQQKRIDAGVASGQLNARETNRTMFGSSSMTKIRATCRAPSTF